MDFSKLIQPDNPVFAGGLGLAVMALGAQVLFHCILFDLFALHTLYILT